MRNKLIAFTLAAALALLAAGCMERAADEVSETVSQAKSELENAGSRLDASLRKLTRNTGDRGTL